MLPLEERRTTRCHNCPAYQDCPPQAILYNILKWRDHQPSRGDACVTMTTPGCHCEVGRRRAPPVSLKNPEITCRAASGALVKTTVLQPAGARRPPAAAGGLLAGSGTGGLRGD
ncbi:unnamed protein product [Merluccius merluccius]